MNVLHLSAVKNWGGGENHIQNLCEELEHIAPEVNNYIMCAKNGKFHRKLKDTDLKIIPSRIYHNLDLAYCFKLIWFCKKNKTDLIHIHDTTALALAVIADYFWKLPPFIFSKKTSFPVKNRKRTIHKYNYPKIQKILCVSQETRRVTAGTLGDLEKLVTIYHGTSLRKKSTVTRFNLREALNIPEEKKIVGIIANHTRAKNLETLIEVVNQVIYAEKRHDFHFVQFGDFTRRTKALKRQIKKYALEKNLDLLGFIPDASNYIPQFDMLLMTSQSEGVPGAIYESFYHEVPVVSTNVGGIPEVITHGINGLLAPAHDHIKLTKHILLLNEDKELREKIIKLSKLKVHSHFTTELMAQKTLAEYKSILNGRFKKRIEQCS